MNTEAKEVAADATDIVEQPMLPPVVFSVTEATLSELREKWADQTKVTEENYDFFKTGCKQLVSLRTSIEAERNTQLKLSRQHTDNVNNEAKRVTAAVAEIEMGPAKLKADYDAKQKAAKEKAEHKEKLRTDAINNLIDLIVSLGTDLDDMTSEELTKRLDDLASMELTDEVYAEFLAVAKEHHESSIARVTTRRYKRIEFEQAELRNKEEAEKLAAEREADEKKRAAEQAEIDRQKEELAEKQRKFEQEQDARATELAEEAAQRQADLDKQDADRKAEAEAIVQAARDKEIAEEAAQAERDKIAREAAEKAEVEAEAAELAPDKVKLAKYAEAIHTVAENAPELGHDKARKILTRCVSSLVQVSDMLRDTADKL